MPKQRPIAGIDLNGPVRDCPQTYWRKLRELTHLDIDWETFSMLGKGIIAQGVKFRRLTGGKPRAVTMHDWLRMQRHLNETDEFLDSVPTPDAAASLELLMEQGYRVFIVSTIRGVREGRVRDFLGKNRIPYEELVLTRRQPKKLYYQHCQLVIDNEPQHLMPVIGGGRTLVLFCSRRAAELKRRGAPEQDPDIHVAGNWQEAQAYFAL